MVSARLMTSALLWDVKCCSLKALRSRGRGLTFLYVLMYHIFAVSLSQVAARRVCLSAGISASSMYSSTVNIHEVTVAMDVSVPSNLSGMVILIDSGILDSSCDSEGVSGRDSGSDSVCVSSVCLWGTFISVCLWSAFVSWVASGVRPRARNSLERGMLTVGRKALTFGTFSRC